MVKAKNYGKQSAMLVMTCPINMYGTYSNCSEQRSVQQFRQLLAFEVLERNVSHYIAVSQTPDLQSGRRQSHEWDLE
jgi:hypothetical protein